jgi:hypothetical protein
VYKCVVVVNGFDLRVLLYERRDPSWVGEMLLSWSLLHSMSSLRLVLVDSKASLSPGLIGGGVGSSLLTASLMSVRSDSRYVMITLLEILMAGRILFTASLITLMSLSVEPWGVALDLLGWVERHMRSFRWSWSVCVISVSEVWLDLSMSVAAETVWLVWRRSAMCGAIALITSFVSCSVAGVTIVGLVTWLSLRPHGRLAQRLWLLVLLLLGGVLLEGV